MDQEVLQHQELPDTHQSAWHLAVIQLTGVASLPVLATSALLLQEESFLSAFITVFIGNIILFFLRLGIVSMSFSRRESTLDISKSYMGITAGYFIAILLLLSTIAWFVVQTTLATNALTYLMPIKEPVDYFIQMSILLGVVSTLFCMEGIIMLRWLSTIAFPIIILACLFVIFHVPHQPLTWNFSSFSVSGLILVLATNLGVTADLPTFFRHSRSKKTAIHALVLIQIVSFLLGVAGLYLGAIIKPWEGLNEISPYLFNNGTYLRLALYILIFVSVVCANVANVYSASVGWELIAPIFAGRREYLILGLGLTIIYILIANVFSLEFLLSITDNALVNLCLVLLVGYVYRLFMKRHPDQYEKMALFIAWLVSTVIITLQLAEHIFVDYSTLSVGFVVVITIFFVFLLLKGIYKMIFAKANK